MLDVCCSTRPQLIGASTTVTETIKMPSDLSPYLLSSSPPGFDVHYSLMNLKSSFSGSRLSKRDTVITLPPAKVVTNNTVTNNIVTNNIVTNGFTIKRRGVDRRNTYNENAKNSNDNKQLMNVLKNDTDVGIMRKAKSLPMPTSEESIKLRRELRKKVSFADENGLSLVEVRLMTEASDAPPSLRPEILSSLTQGASAGALVVPPLKLCFTQPASDYLAFKQKLENNFVSLENVILKDYKLLGTVKVKNVSFHKQVVVRCTYNSWESHVDVSCNYIPGICAEQPGATSFDTFSFEISVPPNFDVRKKIQFCIQFTTENGEYWDNNTGANYEVKSADWKDTTSPTHEESVFALNRDKQSEPWSEFTSWTHIDQETPYY